MTIERSSIKSPVGPLTIETDDLGVVGIAFGASKPKSTSSGKSSKAKSHMRNAVSALKRYFDGDMKALGKLRVHLDGTPFQVLVWQALAKVPAGKVVSYAELAKRVGARNAVRAVATTCGKNPVCIAIPCHRVVASDGSLGGFTGGLAKKKQLLAHEGARVLSSQKKPSLRYRSSRRTASHR